MIFVSNSVIDFLHKGDENCWMRGTWDSRVVLETNLRISFELFWYNLVNDAWISGIWIYGLNCAIFLRRLMIFDFIDPILD